MSEFVFILGAGFSRPAGAPVMTDFLERAEREIGASAAFRAVASAISELQIAYSKANLDLYNLEAVFGVFEMARLIPIARIGPLHNTNAADQLIALMKTMIAKTLEQSILFPAKYEPLQAYAPFADLLQRLNGTELEHGYRCSLITFNYDLIPDHTLTFSGCGFDYCIHGGPPSATPLLKLHGSLNWANCGCGQIVSWNIGDYFNQRDFPPNATQIRFKMASNLGVAQLAHCTEAMGTEPVIVPPTWSKTEHHHAIAQVWRRAAAELSDAENIIVIGYSLPETDAFFRYLYALGAIGGRLIKRFWVFNPDLSTKPRFEQLLGKAVAKRFRFSSTPFPSCLQETRDEFQDRLKA